MFLPFASAIGALDTTINDAISIWTSRDSSSPSSTAGVVCASKPEHAVSALASCLAVALAHALAHAQALLRALLGEAHSACEACQFMPHFAGALPYGVASAVVQLANVLYCQRVGAVQGPLRDKL